VIFALEQHGVHDLNWSGSESACTKKSCCSPVCNTGGWWTGLLGAYQQSSWVCGGSRWGADALHKHNL